MAKSVKSNVINNLDLLPSGPLPPNPSELLASENFKALLEQFARNYDYVIIDTPPINVVSDAMVMKDSISGIMLVIRYAMTTYEDLANCMKQIELAKVNMLGFVLNDVHHNHGANYYNYKYKYKKYGYGYGSYGYGYTYGNNPTEETKENENAD
jgi:capsular exopolysaccharide synthesis family protein